ncbi:MAG: homoserine O-acetyltransferase [Desulfarculus sp.]|nr:homoserine O-acetyltransferase [Desulfarculus sp.]
MLVQPSIARFEEPLALTSGACLPGGFQIAYECYGRLSPQADNAILVCHGLTANAHAAGRHAAEDPKPGWWDQAIGPGRPLDTERFCVVCSNLLGGCGGSSGPASPHPQDGRPWALRWPVLTIADMVDAQARLADRLGIERWRAVVGGCMGGFQVLEWLARYPARVDDALAISTSARVSAHTLALWEVVREAIRRDPDFQDGDYYGGPAPLAGMGLGTMFGMMIWMSRQVMGMRFGLRLTQGHEPRYSLEPEFAIQAFFQQVAQGGARGFDPNSLIYLTKAMDFFDLSRGRPSLAQAFAGGRSRVLLVSYDSDWRYPPEDSEELRQAMAAAGLVAEHLVLHSEFGHGAFIYDSDGVGRAMAEFLA